MISHVGRLDYSSWQVGFRLRELGGTRFTPQVAEPGRKFDELGTLPVVGGFLEVQLLVGHAEFGEGLEFESRLGLDDAEDLGGTIEDLVVEVLRQFGVGDPRGEVVSGELLLLGLGLPSWGVNLVAGELETTHVVLDGLYLSIVLVRVVKQAFDDIGEAVNLLHVLVPTAAQLLANVVVGVALIALHRLLQVVLLKLIGLLG